MLLNQFSTALCFAMKGTSRSTGISREQNELCVDEMEHGKLDIVSQNDLSSSMSLVAILSSLASRADIRGWCSNPCKLFRFFWKHSRPRYIFSMACIFSHKQCSMTQHHLSFCWHPLRDTILEILKHFLICFLCYQIVDLKSSILMENEIPVLCFG